MLRQLAQDQFSGMRVKEVLIFMLGYAMGEFEKLRGYVNQENSICSNKDKKTQISIQSMLKLFSQEMGKNFLVTKKYLIELFSTIIDILKSIKIFTLLKTHEQVYEIFRILVVEGLKSSQIQKDNMQKMMAKIFEQFILEKQKCSKGLFPPQEKKLQQQKEPFTVPSQNICQKSQKICQICMFPFTMQQNSLDKSLIISKCQHQFHQQCIFEMIKQHLNSQNDIISQVKKQQASFLTFSQHKQTFTKIKCPNFQLCSVYLTLQEIHNFLSNLSDEKKGQFSSNKKDSQLLNKIYEKTFNQYLINQNIRSFDELHQNFRSQKSHVHENSLYLFYCKTPGCNAIYEIKQNENKSIDNSVFYKKPDKFICLSCKQPFCLQCFSPLHPTMTCKQNLISASTLPEDQELQKFIKTLKKPYKKCPKCRFYVDNWRGCSTVKCRCGTQFCFKCGNIGCPHAKCLKEMQKEQRQKLLKEKQDKEKDQQKKINE